MPNSFKDHLPANLNSQEAHEPYYEDSRAMVLSHYVMAERCLQVEEYKIFEDFKEGDYSTLTYILEGGFRGVDLTRFAGKNETCVQVTMKRDFEKEGERSSSDNFFDNIKLTRSQAAALARSCCGGHCP